MRIHAGHRRNGCRAALVALTTSLVITANAQAATHGGVSWRACSDAKGFQCATLKAPLDYDAPSGPQISLALIRRPASDRAHRVGSLFWNSGGPGGAPTADLPKFAPFFSKRVRARFDIVSFDPRGIGASAQLRCFKTPAEEAALLGKLPPAGFPTGDAETRLTIETNAQLAKACAQNGGPIQDHMSTANVARDMDRIRAALGVERLNYYGPSYGSYLGATYANLFRSRVRRMVLDGNVPPVEWNDARTGVFAHTFMRITSPAGTEAALQMMLAACGAVDAGRCAFSAGSPSATAQKYRTLLDRVRAKPVSLGDASYTSALVVSTVSAGLFVQNKNALAPGWKELATMLQTLWAASADPAVPPVAPPPAATAAQEPGGSSGQFAPELPEGINGVVCGESPNPRNPASYEAQAALANATQSPSGFGSVWAWLSAPCAQWQGRDADRYTGPWNRSPVPVLAIGTLGDPRTSYTGSVRMVTELGNARLLTESGGGHLALANPSECVDDHVDRYLFDGKLPRSGTVCKQDKRPF